MAAVTTDVPETGIALEVNMGQAERWLSLIGGGALLWHVMRHYPLGLLLALAGGSLILRGLTGHCYVYAGLEASRQTRIGARQEKWIEGAPERTLREEGSPPADRVDEAGWESFPASDPPSWTR